MAKARLFNSGGSTDREFDNVYQEISSISGAAGDMTKAVYDPGSVTADAFDMANMNGQTHRTFYTDGSGDTQELSHGTSGKVLKSNGTTSAPSWEDESGGGGVTVTTGSGAPASTPGAIGDVYIDTTNDLEYRAYGTSSSGDWEPQSGNDSEGAYNFASINGTLTKVYTKYFTGTTDNDNLTEVAHGIADFNKILSCSSVVAANANTYLINGEYTALGATFDFGIRINATNINIQDVGTEMRNENYRLKIDYYL